MRLVLPLAAFALLALPVAAQTTTPAPTHAQAPAAGAVEHQGARAQRHGYLPLDKRFEMANTTHDGHLTLDQARSATVMHTVAGNFEAIDKDHRGFVTEDDIRAWYKARRSASRHGGEGAATKS